MGRRVEFDDLPEVLWAVQVTIPATGHVFVAHVGKTEEYARKMAARQDEITARSAQVLRATVTWKPVFQPPEGYVYRCWWGTWWHESTARSVNFRCHCSGRVTGEHPIRLASEW